MMQRGTLDVLQLWFDDYVRTFVFSDPLIQKGIDVKVEHSLRVRAEIADLGRSIGLSEPDLCFAEAAGLVHDIGRFEQFTRFRTFSDRESVNHAEFGIGVLRESGVVRELDPETREALFCVIGNHNRKTLPPIESNFVLTQSRLLRDVDKLDIFRVLIDFYHEDDADDTTMALGLSDAPDISQEVIADLFAGRQVDSRHLRTVNDFKMMKLGWVHDLNFPETFRRVCDRGYLATIRGMLPDAPEVRQAYEKVQAFLEERCEK